MAAENSMQALADFVVDGTITITDSLRDASLLRLVDGISASMAGTVEPVGVIITDLVRSYGGVNEATVIGADLRVPADLAALANGCMMHALDWDDFTKTNMHPTSVTLPAVLAVGETIGSTGAEALESFIMGAEVAARLARMLNPAIFLRGFHPSGTVGSIASAASAARLFELTAEQTSFAFALAIMGSGGLLANKGTMAKPVHVGNAGRAGIMAARLAAAGVDASKDILGARYGIQDAMLDGLREGYDLDALTLDLGSRWELERDWIVKPYPVGGGRLTLIEACIELAQEHDLDPQEIETVTAMASPFVLRVDHPEPLSATDGRFSHAYCAAIALVDRAAGVPQFEEARFGDPVVRDLMRKVRLVPDPDLGMRPAEEGLPTTVVVTVRGGQTYQAQVRHSQGEADRPATLSDVRQKFLSCAPSLLDDPAANELWSTLIALPQEPSVTALTRHLGKRSDRMPRHRVAPSR